MCLRHCFISFKLPQPFFGHRLWTNITTFYGADSRMAQDVYANEERSARLWIPGLSPFPQAPGPAGLARTCLESQQCTPTEVIYYLFPSYLFVSVSWNLPVKDGACVTTSRGNNSHLFLTNNVGDWPNHVSGEEVGCWGPKVWTRKCLTPSHYRTLWHLPNFFVIPFFFWWGFCCVGRLLRQPERQLFIQRETFPTLSSLSM